MNTAEILSMVKIFLPKGLSARVRNAKARRLQSAMAVRADTAETPVEEGALSLQRKRRKMTLVRMEALHGPMGVFGATRGSTS